MTKKKLIFLGSKPIGFKCLEILISKKDALNIEISGILTKHRTEFSGSSNLLILAKENNIPVLSKLDEIPDCDIIYSIQFHEILKVKDINKASQIAVNLHMAPLPEYRGSNQFSFALIDQKKEFGTTIHAMDAGVDNGDILFQKRFPIPDNCWVGDLYDLTYHASVKLFEQTISHIVNGNYNRLPQEALIAKYGSQFHYRREIDDIKVIELYWDKEKIERHIRATAMPGFESPYCIIDGKKIFFSPYVK